MSSQVSFIVKCAICITYSIDEITVLSDPVQPAYNSNNIKNKIKDNNLRYIQHIIKIDKE